MSAIVLFLLVSAGLAGLMPAASYQDYQRVGEERFGIKVCVPENNVDYRSDPRFVFDFGSPDASNTAPVFLAGPIVALSPDCLVVLEQYCYFQAPRNDMPSDTASISFFHGILRNNCGVSWQSWYKDKRNDSRFLKECEGLSIQHLPGNPVVKSGHAYAVTTFLFPRYDRIRCGLEDINNRIRKEYSICYGVEFSCTDKQPIRMLFFVKQEAGQDIAAHIEAMSRYLSFTN